MHRGLPCVCCTTLGLAGPWAGSMRTSCCGARPWGSPLGLLQLRYHLEYDLLRRGYYTYAYAYDMRNVCRIA